MKQANLVSIFIVISFFLSNLSFSYQVFEKGILFGNKQETPVVNQQKAISQPGVIAYEKKEDGSDSSIYLINDLTQFLDLSLKSDKPLVIKIFSNNNESIIYQDLAEQLNDQFIFVSIAADNKSLLNHLLISVLAQKGVLPQKEIKLPLFLLCKPDFVVMQPPASMSFRKSSLGLLLNPGISGQTELNNALKRVNEDQTGQIILDESDSQTPQK